MNLVKAGLVQLWRKSFHYIPILFHLKIVHRIGRTGRSGKTGLATTFINKANDESVLLDLKHLLIEARQKVPLFLAELESENERYLQLGGSVLIIILLDF